MQSPRTRPPAAGAQAWPVARASARGPHAPRRSPARPYAERSPDDPDTPVGDLRHRLEVAEEHLLAVARRALELEHPPLRRQPTCGGEPGKGSVRGPDAMARPDDRERVPRQRRTDVAGA